MMKAKVCQAPVGWHPAWVPTAAPLLSATRQMLPDPLGQHYGAGLDGLARRPDDAISMMVKLPFCAVRCLCCDRDVRTAQPGEVIDDYVAGLIDEIGLLADRIGVGRDVLQLHLGGGTVNELSEPQLARLVHALKRTWRLPSDAEMSVECDPRRTRWVQLRLLRGLGFRHVTFGVLDLDPTVQRAIGRLHSAALIDDVCSLARSCGFEYINLELMIGLPHQNEMRWRATVERLVSMAPDRVTLAQYRHHPWHAPAQYAIDADALPEAAECRALAAVAAEILCEAGYRWIGADRFVLETDELALALEQGRLRRSLISYTAVPPTPVLGLGVGGVGELDGGVYWNETSIPLWRAALRAGRLPVGHAQLATERESKRRVAVEHLLCRLEFPLAMAQDGLEDLYRRLATHEASGAVRVFDDRIAVTESGRHALLSLCADLDGAMASRPATVRQPS